MKYLFPILAFALAAGVTGCSSSRNAQSSDDVYYSSGHRSTVAAASNNDEYYSTAPSDNYIRMKAEDPRFSTFDDYNAYDSYYYTPVSASFGYGYPAYGFGYGMGLGYGYPMYGLGFGYGLGFWDPYMCWNSYFLWNSWYNPYFYNPYYGGGVFVVGKGAPTAIYSNLRPFNRVAYTNGIGHHVGTSTSPNVSNRFYRPGMSTTSNYNSGLSGQGRPVNNTYYRPGTSNGNGFRPVNNNNGYRPAPSFSQPVRSYSPSFGGGGGGGFSRPGHH